MPSSGEAKSTASKSTHLTKIEGFMRGRSSGSGSLTILASIGVCTGLYFGSVIFIPLVASLFLFALLEPVVQFAEKKTPISRKIISPALVLGTFLAVAVIIWGGSQAVTNLTQEIPKYSGKIKSTIQSIQKQTKILQEGTQNIMSTPQSGGDKTQKVELVEDSGSKYGKLLLSGLDSLFGIMTAVFLIPILCLFLLLEKPYLEKKLLQAVGKDFPLGQVGTEIVDMIRGFFVGNLIVGAATSAGFFVLFKILGLENSLTLALTSGFINLIPILGAVLSVFFPLAQAVLQFNTVAPCLIIGVTALALHFIIANLVMPKVVGSRINVNPTAATVGLIFWGWLWGGVGLLLAIPLTATFRILMSTEPSTKAWASLLTEEGSGKPGHK